MLTIEAIRYCCTNAKIVLTEHLLTRMRERGFCYEDITGCLNRGEIIEQYPTDYPFPSCLINSSDLHVVCSMGEDVLYIITAYRPSPVQWTDGGKTRKEAKQ